MKLKIIGEKCQQIWESSTMNLKRNSNDNKNYATMFILSSTKTAPMNSKCLDNVLKAFADTTGSNERICELTTRAISNKIQEERGKRNISMRRSFSGRSPLEGTGHTEEDLLGDLQREKLKYRNALHEECSDRLTNDEDAKAGGKRGIVMAGVKNKKITKAGSKREIEQQKYHLYLYSYFSPCTKCMKEIKNYSNNQAEDIEIVKTLVSFDVLSKDTSPEILENAGDTTELWVTSSILNKLRM